MAIYRYPQAGAGLYRIGGLLFQDGVAEADELSNADKEVLEMLGIEADAPAEDSEPDKTPDAANPVSDEDRAAAEQIPTGSSFAETPEQAAALPHEVVTTDSDSSGQATLDAPQEPEHAEAEHQEG